VKIISTSPLSHVVTELGELNPGSPGPGHYRLSLMWNRISYRRLRLQGQRILPKSKLVSWEQLCPLFSAPRFRIQVTEKRCYSPAGSHSYPLLKRTKDRSLSNAYRRISLTSCVCKTMVLVLPRRVQYVMNTRNPISIAKGSFR
jgi:hypothetical protein